VYLNFHKIGLTENEIFAEGKSKKRVISAAAANQHLPWTGL